MGYANENEDAVMVDVVMFYRGEMATKWETFDNLVDAIECTRHLWLTTVQGVKTWDHTRSFINEEGTYGEVFVSPNDIRCVMTVIR